MVSGAMCVLPTFSELAHSSRGEVLEIAPRVPGVFAAELDLSRKGEVVADEDPGARNEAGRVALVVGISEADDPCVFGDVLTREPHLEDSEVARSIVAEGMER